MVFPSLLLLMLVLSMPEVDEKTSLGLISLSSGTWATYGDLNGYENSPYSGDIEKYVFNKLLAVSVYGRLGRYGYHVGLPWQWTVKSSRDGSENRVDPGDLTAYLSRKWFLFDARLGFVMPGGYDTRNGDPWIGQGNRQMLLGTGVRLPIHSIGTGADGSLEVEFAYSLDDGIAKKGSWSLSPTFKIQKRLNSGLNGEVYLMGFYKSYYWDRSATLAQSLWGANGPESDRKAGLVPGMSLQARLMPKVYAGIKGGHSLWGYREKASYHAALFLNVYP